MFLIGGGHAAVSVFSYDAAASLPIQLVHDTALDDSKSGFRAAQGMRILYDPTATAGGRADSGINGGGGGGGGGGSGGSGGYVVSHTTNSLTDEGTFQMGMSLIRIVGGGDTAATTGDAVTVVQEWMRSFPATPSFSSTPSSLSPSSLSPPSGRASSNTRTASASAALGGHASRTLFYKR